MKGDMKFNFLRFSAKRNLCQRFISRLIHERRAGLVSHKLTHKKSQFIFPFSYSSNCIITCPVSHIFKTLSLPKEQNIPGLKCILAAWLL